MFLFSETIRGDTYSQLSFSYSMNTCASLIKSKRKVSSFSIYIPARAWKSSLLHMKVPLAQRPSVGAWLGSQLDWRDILSSLSVGIFLPNYFRSKEKWVGSYRKCAWVTSPFLPLLHRRMTILRMEIVKLSSSHVLGLSKIRMLTKKTDRRWPAEDEAIYHGREPSCCQSRCLVDDTAGSAGSSFFTCFPSWFTTLDYQYTVIPLFATRNVVNLSRII